MAEVASVRQPVERAPLVPARVADLPDPEADRFILGLGTARERLAANDDQLLHDSTSGMMSPDAGRPAAVLAAAGTPAEDAPLADTRRPLEQHEEVLDEART